MEMDAVNAFNGEMLSMIDMTPPISRAKMMSVTKAGIKAIKLYKHVVQIVEKFIKRCKPDLKVAGLYVVDSIIRQSRHQFGADKDVFAPRFLKNFNATFENLYQCPADDKGKILRVLNLWQKNEVFGMDIIQPLLDMATAPVLPVLENGTTVSAPPAALMAVPQPAPQPAALPAPLPVPVPVPQPVPAVATVTAQPTIQNPVALAAVAQLLQGTQGVELQQLLQTLQQSSGAGLSLPSAPPTEQKTSLAKTLLDRFDYDDEPEPVEEKPEPPAAAPITINLPPELQQALQAHLLSQIANQTQIQMQGQVASHGIPAAVQEFSATVQEQITDNTPRTHTDSSTQPTTQSPQGSAAETDSSGQDGRDRRHRQSRSRSPQRQSSSRSQRSRSGSHSRRSRHRRTRSRSRERQRRSPHARSEERREREKEREKERERERERRQKGLPSIKKETLSVCSTTLWIGQLDKRTQKQDIMSLMEEFGQIESINMIPPRGCAYIVMVHRQDANTALSKLSRGAAKVNQKAIKIAWALNKGIKTEFKKFWDVERGVTYIPWDKVKPDEIQSLREGGMLDAETLKSEWNIVVANPIVPVTGGPEGRQGNGAALPAVPQSPVHHPAENALPVPPNMGLPPPAMMTSLPLPTFPPPGFNLPQMPAGFPHVAPMAPMNPSGPRPTIPSENPLEEPSKHSPEGPKSHIDSTGGQPLNSPPPAGFLGPRPGFLPPQTPVGPRPPFMPPFPNDMPRPNMPPPNMPRQMMPPHMMQPQMMPHRGPNPMFREPHAGRFRMPMMRPPVENFPPPREGVPPQGPPRGPMEEEQWEEKPYWNDWQEHGPERGPERFGNGPPFQRGGWGRGRGGHRGRGNFGN